MQYQFTIQTTKDVPYREGKLRRWRKEKVTMQVAIEIDGKVCRLGYGYQTWETKHNEGRFSATPGRDYRIFHQMMPKEGDVWSYRGRTFTVGKREGFLNYSAPLLEDGRQVATIHFEDYYKD